MQKSLLSEIGQKEMIEQVLREGWDMSNPCNNHFLKLAQEKKEMKRMHQALQQIINVTKGSKAYSDGAKAHYIAFSTLKSIQGGGGMVQHLIDADKLMDWLKVMIKQSSNAERGEGYVDALDAVMVSVGVGKFNPDPPYKVIKCGKCELEEVLDGNQPSICPFCGGDPDE